MIVQRGDVTDEACVISRGVVCSALDYCTVVCWASCEDCDFGGEVMMVVQFLGVEVVDGNGGCIMFVILV